MGIEIERRWLIEQDVSEVLKGQLGEQKVEQSYIVDTGGWVQRIRVVISKHHPDRFYMTMKRPSAGFSNHEIEFEISVKTFRELEAHTGPTLIKQRHFIAHGPLTIELDVFRNFKLINLIIAEVELPSEDHPFTPPDWFGTEITGKKAYSNVALAMALRDPPAGPFVEMQRRGALVEWTPEMKAAFNRIGRPNEEAAARWVKS